MLDCAYRSALKCLHHEQLLAEAVERTAASAVETWPGAEAVHPSYPPPCTPKKDLSCLQNPGVTPPFQTVMRQHLQIHSLPFPQDILDFLKSYFVGACQRIPQAIKLCKINSATAIHICLRMGVMNVVLILPGTSRNFVVCLSQHCRRYLLKSTLYLSIRDVIDV